MDDVHLPSGMMMKIVLTVLVMIISAVFFSCSATRGMSERNPADRAAVASIRFFQNVISKADGDRCNMQPSCSQYAIDAIKAHGVFMGWIMTCDRLMRCGGDEDHVSPLRLRGDMTYCLDPITNNDFWWHDGQ